MPDYQPDQPFYTTSPDQAKQLPNIISPIAQTILSMLNKPIDAAQSIMQQGSRPPSQMTIDPGRAAFMAGPGAMMSMFGRAPINSLGISSGKLLNRTDVYKFIKDSRTKGMTPKQITDSVNTRYAPILDEGAYVTPNQMNGIMQKIGRENN